MTKRPLTHVLELLSTATITTAGVTTLTINGGTLTDPQALSLSVSYWSGMTLTEYMSRIVSQLYGCPDVYAVTTHDTGTARLIFVTRLVEADQALELVPTNLALAIATGQGSIAVKQSVFGRYEFTVPESQSVHPAVWGLGGLGLGLLFGRSD